MNSTTATLGQRPRSDEPARGWVFYDAECAFCLYFVSRWRGWLQRSGVDVVPLQTPGTAERLGVSPAELLSAMYLLTVDGRRFAGADAYVEIARYRVWTKPFAWLAVLPGARLILRRLYAAIAARRHCLAGACRLDPPRPSARRRPHRSRRSFLEMP